MKLYIIILLKMCAFSRMAIWELMFQYKKSHTHTHTHVGSYPVLFCWQKHLTVSILAVSKRGGISLSSDKFFWVLSMKLLVEQELFHLVLNTKWNTVGAQFHV